MEAGRGHRDAREARGGDGQGDPQDRSRERKGEDDADQAGEHRWRSLG